MRPCFNAFLDIETTGLSLGYSQITVVGIHLVSRYTTRLIQLVGDDITAEKILEALHNTDIIHTYNGSRFDNTILRSKALHYDLDFPEYGSLRHIDLYYIAKYKLRVGYASLENNCNYCNIRGKTKIDPDLWLKAITSANKQAINDILYHNEQDLIITEKLFDKLRPYTKLIRISI